MEYLDAGDIFLFDNNNNRAYFTNNPLRFDNTLII